jgi:chromosome segregation ATPase
MRQTQLEHAEMLAKEQQLQRQLDAAAKREAEAKQREASANERIATLEKERDNLRASHERLRVELELYKRRIFIAKAERADN